MTCYEKAPRISISICRYFKNAISLVLIRCFNAPALFSYETTSTLDRDDLGHHGSKRVDYTLD